jgi:CheY-like chemotaxis protein/anti-sigma regulatory factor (Ser/Thr protein kinase)
LTQVADISPFSRELTALFVEDDLTSRLLVSAMLRGVFKELVTASDGLEGLKAFQARRPDLVLTDHAMPGLSGLAMTEEIRKTDAKVPVIFITGTIDTALLVEAINLGISAFIPKPVAMASLRHAVGLVTGMLEKDHLQRRNLDQELALLQLRERYHEHQQELAFRKELSILENDFLWRSFAFDPASGRGEWVAQVIYSPHDIMCGDSYGLRARPDGMLVFLADAMGKGLAAALTSSLSVYTFNLLVDALAGPLDFAAFAQQYASLMAKRLLEDEVLSFCLAWLPRSGAPLQTAAFGMPPMLAGAPGEPVVKLKCNNPPLSAYFDGFRTTSHDLGSARALLLYTDGLNEAVTADGSLYRDHLEAAFATSSSSRQFAQSFRAKVAVPDDDVTVLILARVDAPPEWEERRVVPSRLQAVDEACQQVEDRLEACQGLDRIARIEFGMAVREALLNAYEHGSLEIPGDRKRELLDDGTYFDRILEREKDTARVINLVLSGHAEGANQVLKVAIQDEGKGFKPPSSWSSEPEQLGLSGRGLRMVRKYTDVFYFNAKGNLITLLKVYRGGNDADRSDQSTGTHPHREHQDDRRLS